MKRTLLIGIFGMFSLVGFAQSYTVDTVPNTKLVNNSYVSNPDNILSSEAVSQINSKLSDLEAKTTAQVAVVVIQSIGEADHIEFAQQLFERWGIGKSKKDNGLLILMVMDQRTVRFHTGYGLEGVLPDVICKRIEMEHMIPSFKLEGYNQGMIEGVDQVCSLLTDPTYAEELRDDSVRDANGWNVFFNIALVFGGIILLIWFLVLHWGRKFADSKKKGKDKILYPDMRISRLNWLMEFVVVPFALLFGIEFLRVDIDNHVLLFVGLLYGYFILTLFQKRARMSKVASRFLEQKDYYGAAEFFRSYQGFWLFMTFLFPFPLLFLYFEYLAKKRSFRNHPRDCKNCGKPLRKLDEKADDQYLQKGQVFEEQLGTVDYDVWLCDACQSREVLNYVSRGSKYDNCPKCKTRAFFKESDRTISSATYQSTGTGEITRRCKFCNHVTTSTYTIAQLTRSSDSSSSSGGSSGGGSWGGGSSGGGGASSSW